jgi:hypothetical protein
MARGDNNRKLTDRQRDEIVTRYLTKLPDGTWCGTKMLSKEFDMTPSGINYVLRSRGVAMRDAKESHAHGKQCKPTKNLPTTDSPQCKCGCGETTNWNRRKNRWNAYVESHYRKDSPYKHRDWLEREYVVNNRTMRDIAGECGVTQAAVVKQMKKFGIQRRDAATSHVGRQAGSNNPAWKGGVTPERQRLYKTPEWRRLVSDVIRRDAGKCQRCGSGKTSGKTLHAHHIAPWADAPSLRTEMTNLVTLCTQCHLWVHSRGNQDSQFLLRIPA